MIFNNYFVFTHQVEEQQRAIAKQRKERGEEWRSEVLNSYCLVACCVKPHLIISVLQMLVLTYKLASNAIVCEVLNQHCGIPLQICTLPPQIHRSH